MGASSTATKHGEQILKIAEFEPSSSRTGRSVALTVRCAGSPPSQPRRSLSKRRLESGELTQPSISAERLDCRPANQVAGSLGVRHLRAELASFLDRRQRAGKSRPSSRRADRSMVGRIPDRRSAHLSSCLAGNSRPDALCPGKLRKAARGQRPKWLVEKLERGLGSALKSPGIRALCWNVRQSMPFRMETGTAGRNDCAAALAEESRGGNGSSTRSGRRSPSVRSTDARQLELLGRLTYVGFA